MTSNIHVVYLLYFSKIGFANSKFVGNNGLINKFGIGKHLYCTAFDKGPRGLNLS